jgi:hypothetical protein
MTGVLTPYGTSMAEHLPHLGLIAGQTPRQGTPMISGAGQLCEARARAAGYLKLACFSHGRVIFAGSTFLRKKIRCDLFTGRSITAQSRCSSTSLPPVMAHKRPALPEVEIDAGVVHALLDAWSYGQKKRGRPHLMGFP